MQSIRRCRVPGHDDQRVICINTNLNVQQKWACGICSFDQQRDFVHVDNFFLQLQQLQADYKCLDFNKQIKQHKDQIEYIKQASIAAIESKCRKLEQETQQIQNQHNHINQLIAAHSQQDLLQKNDNAIYELLQFMQGGSDMWIQKGIQDKISKLNQNISQFQTHINSFIEPLKLQVEVALLDTIIIQEDLRNLYNEYDQLMIIELPKHFDGIKGQFNYSPIQLSDNVYYVGEWHQNVMNGVGLLVNSKDNCVYKGNWKNDIFIWGLKLDLTKGVLYKGEMVQSTQYQYCIEGDGLGINIQHEQYNGVYISDLQHGKGCMIYYDNSIYQGDWNLGKMDGFGLYKFPNNDTYVGQFQNNLFNGHGELICGNIKYSGQFLNGIKHGRGQLLIDNEYRYNGFFKNNMFEGDGQITYTNGTKFTGKFHNDQKHGEGEEEAIIAEANWQSKGVFSLTLFRQLQIRNINGSNREITCKTNGQYVNNVKNGIHILRKFYGNELLETVEITYNNGVELNRNGQ